MMRRWRASLRRQPMWRCPLGDGPAVPGGGSQPLASRQRIALTASLFLLMVVIASSHQLSPLMAVVMLTALSLAGLARPWSLPIVMLAMTVVWGLTAAGAYVRGNLEQFSETGRLVGNVQGTLVDLGQVSGGQVVVSWMARGLTALVIILALAGAFRAYRHGRFYRAALVMMLGPGALVALSSYGTEILFRVFVFSLPFSAFFVAMLFVPDSSALPGWRPLIAVAGVSTFLLVGFLFAYYGNEHLNYFTPAEVEAADYVYSTAPRGSLIVEGSRSYPGLSRNHEYFVHVPIAREPWETQEGIVANPVERLGRWLSDDKYPRSYLIITRSQKIQTKSQGKMPPGGLEDIEAALLSSPDFEVWFGNDDATIFVVAPEELEP